MKPTQIWTGRWCGPFVTLAVSSEVGKTDASSPILQLSEVDATAVTKQIAELASVAIPSRSPLRFGQIAVVATFDSRDPIAPGVDPAATRLRTAMMNG